MSARVKTNLAKYGTCAVVTALLIWAYLGPRDFAGAALQERCRLLCAAFTIPGLGMVLLGSLLWASNEGALWGISYCVRVAISALMPGARREGYERYGDYVARKMQNPVRGFSFLFISGGSAMAVALVFWMLYQMQ